MSRRKEKVREGLEIDFDLLDSDLLRCYMTTWFAWRDGPTPVLVWLEFVDSQDWAEGMSAEPKVMMRTLDNEQELAEGRRFLRLLRYKSYPCLADLAKRRKEKGEFVIRRPPGLGYPQYVSNIDAAIMPPGLSDPDSPEWEKEPTGFWTSPNFADAMRFTHAEAIRLTICFMEVLGRDLPSEHGDYWEPLRADVAEELHVRATRRPRRCEPLDMMLHDLTREPSR
jgi:hypothetical protein